MLLGFGWKGSRSNVTWIWEGRALDDNRGELLKSFDITRAKQVPPRNLLLQTAALLLLQQLHALRVPLAQPFHVARLVHLLAATSQATSIFLTGLLPAVRGRAE